MDKEGCPARMQVWKGADWFQNNDIIPGNIPHFGTHFTKTNSHGCINLTDGLRERGL